MRIETRSGKLIPTLLIVLGLAGPAVAGDEGWVDLIEADGFAAWRGPHGTWAHASSVRVDPKTPARISYESGAGPIIVNGPIGRTRNLATTRSFGDVEAHVEFLVPKGSNAGIKFHEVYEIQIFDSFGAGPPKGEGMGGIYPRAELLPKYHHIDDGIAPKVDASKPPGEWQALDVTFRAPRFDAKGVKTANARIVRATLNGVLIHDDVELKTPTGHAWTRKEVASAPFLLQADHGPVAFRSIRLRPLGGPPASP